MLFCALTGAIVRAVDSKDSNVAAINRVSLILIYALNLQQTSVIHHTSIDKTSANVIMNQANALR